VSVVLFLILLFKHFAVLLFFNLLWMVKIWILISNKFFFLLGVGGNLVAVQASRLSTTLHLQGKPGEYEDEAQYRASKICPNPYKVFFSNSKFVFLFKFSYIWKSFVGSNSSTTRVLLFMSVPGHLTFVSVIWKLAADHTRLSILFIFLYIIAALIQVKSIYLFF
jgi:solute carrier family 41